MNTGDMRLEREVMQLERELKMLKSTRYESPAASDYYLRLKVLYARRKAMLDARRRRREPVTESLTLMTPAACPEK
jgi:hypothetical protein